MNASKIAALVALSALAFGARDLFAQQPQIPTLQVCNITVAKGEGGVKINSRVDGSHTGTFRVRLDLKCDPAGDGYPVGTLMIAAISMSDSTVQGPITATTFEQMTSTGKHTPTLYVNGRCKAEGVRGCRYWLMIANNRKANTQGTPDVASFLAFDATGKRVAYGTGPVVEGDLEVAPTGN
ncbi:MAG TPA: hypothetical protein VHC97_23405 [Thermoanaerobaculia bacterium]|jgi:hypothetical protein|nr:hypothetical protein [Thermoanaerobaculia bacterium]